MRRIAEHSLIRIVTRRGISRWKRPMRESTSLCLRSWTRKAVGSFALGRRRFQKCWLTVLQITSQRAFCISCTRMIESSVTTFPSYRTIREGSRVFSTTVETTWSILTCGRTAPTKTNSVRTTSQDFLTSSWISYLRGGKTAAKQWVITQWWRQWDRLRENSRMSIYLKLSKHWFQQAGQWSTCTSTKRRTDILYKKRK